MSEIKVIVAPALKAFLEEMMATGIFLNENEIINNAIRKMKEEYDSKSAINENEIDDSGDTVLDAEAEDYGDYIGEEE